MSRRQPEDETGRNSTDRRIWLGRTVLMIAAPACGPFITDRASAQQEKKLSPTEEAEQELQGAEARVRKVTSRPLQVERSISYQMVGDSSSAFMKLVLADCELVAQDFLEHYRAKGFAVQRPERRLTLIVFADNGPYRKFLPDVPSLFSGVYRRDDNWLVVFDFRNVTTVSKLGGFLNRTTLAHETTHLLAFNTGLLRRQGDVPRAVMEGIAMYGEVRKDQGRSEPGQINTLRLDQLTHLQRRLKWIPLATLLADEPKAFGKTGDQWMLAYAQSWLLVYYLMATPARLPQFRSYLKAIWARRDNRHRLEDAHAHFGALELLDADLQREAIRLQQIRS
jgi:Protein of unknown function (DUF1570)